MKEVLGILIGENESSKYYLKVLKEIRNVDIKNILITSVNGLVRFSNAIKAVFPDTKIQRCVYIKLEIL
ncbi:transposase, Mutator family protein [Clostridioides difficile P51]|nr:transposase, Mutator family protein [Clostridioides difficile P51]